VFFTTKCINFYLLVNCLYYIYYKFLFTLIIAQMADKVKELSASFLSILDNEEVVEKLSKILSESVQLILTEQLKPLDRKLNQIIRENKLLELHLHLENEHLLSTNNECNIKLNHFEQAERANNVLIHGIKPSYAEQLSITDDGDDDHLAALSLSTQPHTLKTVCAILSESCKIETSPSDIKAAYRLKSKTGKLPLLVAFHSTALRNSVLKSRKPKETLRFREHPIYINEHLTAFNTDLFFKARQMVKDKKAFGAWTSDGQILIKWTSLSKPQRVVSVKDLVPKSSK